MGYHGISIFDHYVKMKKKNEFSSKIAVKLIFGTIEIQSFLVTKMWKYFFRINYSLGNWGPKWPM